MVLKPLEFSDCISDSPWFRQNLHEHETALDDAYKSMKNIEAQCRELISCTRKLNQAQKAFSKSLTEFKIETVGTNQTDDERIIATCLKEFGKVIMQIEDERTKILNEVDAVYLEPIKKFRTDAIGKTLHEEKRKYEKESSKFYQSLEKHLHLSTVRKNDFREADAQLDMQQHNFCKASLQYVAEIQSVQERMKFEFVETLSSFLYKWLSFYHVGHIMHEDFKPYLDGVQVRVQKTKESYKTTIAEAEGLKEKMLKVHTRAVATPGASQASAKVEGAIPNIKQGYMFMQEKSKIPKTIGRDVLVKWTKYYCVFSKETRIFTMIPVNSAVKTDMKGALGQSVAFKLKGCTRRSSDSIDRRFCLDVMADDRPDIPMTFQALSEEDRRQWLDAMDGKQQDYSPGTGPSCSGVTTQLDDTGFEFVEACIAALEDRGIREQGLYRNCGVTSKVQKLMQLGLDKRKTSSGEKLNVHDETEWETKTISSAVKTFLRNLPEPLMTFDQHSLFINAAKMDDGRTRVDHIHYYVYQLPATHKTMLQLVIRHLKRVADRCDENLMTVGNLGVCFGPTLLRPKEETMAAIMDIKFCNVVVEVLIANCDQIFNTEPPKSIGQPCPPKPDHRTVQHEQSHPITASSRITDNGRSATASSLSLGVRPRPVHTASPAIRARSPKTPSSSLSSTKAPQSTATVVATVTTKATTTPLPITVVNATAAAHIYDSVALDGTVTKKMIPLYGTASTSGLNTPTTPPQMPQRGAVRTVRDDSCDSLSSLVSHGSDSPKGNASAKTSFAEPKAKMSTSYAPSYNPMACETFSVHRVQAVPVGVAQVIDSAHITMHQTAARVSPMYSSLINPVVSMQPSRRVKTLYACTPDHESELCFQPGQIITNVYESKEDGWLVGTLNGKTGLIPSNYVEPLP